MMKTVLSDRTLLSIWVSEWESERVGFNVPPDTV